MSEIAMTQMVTSVGFCASGLHAHKDGLDGWIFETTVSHSQAVARHHQLNEDFNRDLASFSPGVNLLLGLVLNDAVMTLKDLNLATGRKSIVYQDGENVYIEWLHSDRWRDRRIISGSSQSAIAINEGWVVKSEDWGDAANWLQKRCPGRNRETIWTEFFADAQAWWFERLTGPTFAHAVGLRRLQLLKRSALARRATGRPQIGGEAPDDLEQLDQDRFQLQTTRARSHDQQTLNEFVAAVREIVRRKGGKASARQAMVSAIDGLMPRARQEGRAQVLVLMGTRHVILQGGVSGKLLAPRSLDEYLRKPLPMLATELAKVDVHSRSAQEWRELYRSIIDSAPKLQQKKLEAFVEAFHRYMVICGAEPLQHAISSKILPNPPDAVVVWPKELELAVNFLWSSDCTDIVKEQAELGLRLGYRVAIRIEDLWCVRMVDVGLELRPWIAICPRQRDGYGKSPALRRQEDLDGNALMMALNRVYQRRKTEGAADEDVLLGEAGIPDARHEEDLTTRLMSHALRWASGNPSASFHDLRHTRLSSQSEIVFMGISVDLDVDAMQQVAASGGHAGAGSSVSYQHWIEKAIADQAATVRPLAWCKVDCLSFRFESVGEGLVSAEPLVPEPHRIKPQPTAKDLSLSDRSRLLQHVIDESFLSVAAAKSYVSMEVVKTVLQEMSTALQWAKLADHQHVSSTRLQCAMLRTYRLWARAALQRKHHTVVEFIESLISAGRWTEVRAIWNTWLLCVDGEDIALINVPVAEQMISFLLRASVPTRSLLVVSVDSADPLSPQLARYRLAQRVVVDRPGRRSHRLQMSDSADMAEEMSGASLSMLGLHWWMLCLGSIVL